MNHFCFDINTRKQLANIINKTNRDFLRQIKQVTSTTPFCISVEEERILAAWYNEIDEICNKYLNHIDNLLNNLVQAKVDIESTRISPIIIKKAK